MSMMYKRDIPCNNCLTFSTTANAFRSVWHTQNEFEIVYIESGWGSIQYAQQQKLYTQGDIMVLGPNIPHEYSKKSKDFHSLSILFNNDFIVPGLFDAELTKDIKGFLHKATEGLIFREGSIGEEQDIIRQILGKSGLEQAVNLLLLLDKFSQHRDADTDCFGIKTEDPFGGKKYQRLQNILYYINQHAHRRLLIEEVSNQFFMSRSHFSRFFNQQTGKNFNQYLLEIRVERACRLLNHTDHAITEVAYQVGFESLSSFNRGFQLLKATTPSRYRKK